MTFVRYVITKDDKAVSLAFPLTSTNVYKALCGELKPLPCQDSNYMPLFTYERDIYTHRYMFSMRADSIVKVLTRRPCKSGQETQILLL